MAIQVLPIIKAIAPYLAQIATAAIPAFTSKPAETTRDDSLISKQIEELQAAATQNAESVHVLAEKLQQAIQDIEVAVQDAKKQVSAYRTMIFAALLLSGVSILLVITLLAR